MGMLDRNSGAGRLVNPTSNTANDSSFSDNSSDEGSKKPKAKSKKQDSDLPKRPLSAYNLFFQVERENILNGEEDQNYTYDNVARVALVHYRQCRLGKPKRKHRKSHGVIGFRALAATVAQKWKKLDDNVKQVFEERAAIEKALYDKEIDAIKAARRQGGSQSPSSNLEIEPVEQNFVGDYSERSLGSSSAAALGDHSEQSIIDAKRIMFRNKELLQTSHMPPVEKEAETKPWYFEPSSDAPHGDEAISHSLFEPAALGSVATPLDIGDDIYNNTAAGFPAMRVRPKPQQTWVSDNTLDRNVPSGRAEGMEYNDYTNTTGGVWTNDSAPEPSRQRRRNSTSFYPIDDDEQVDLIQLNDSFRESKDPPCDATTGEIMSEEEAAMSAMLASLETRE